MSTFKRYLAGGPGAFVITVSLGILMANLIKVTFTPDTKTEAMSFEINNVVEDLPPPTERTVELTYVKVETPPPPPVFDYQPTSTPTVPTAILDDRIPPFVPPKLDRHVFTPIISDRDAQPLLRMKPVMPPRAEKSGHCRVRFDVTPDGQPFNVNAHYCTQSVFKRATIKSVERWKYQPKIAAGLPVSRHGVEAKITFKLADDAGRLIPE